MVIRPPDAATEMLLEVTRSITQVLDLDELLQKILDSAADVMGAERACLFVFKPGSPSSEDWVEKRVFRRLEPGDLESEAFQPSLTAINRVMETREGLRQADAMSQVDHSNSVEIHGLRSILCEPLMVHERLIGVIYLDSSKIAALFTRNHQALLRSLAAQAAICIENARLFQQAEEASRQRLEEAVRAREMEARSEMLAAFVSIAAHDLKNPLTVLKGGLQVLERMDLSPPAHTLLPHMKSSVQRAIRLVQTYLDAAHLEEGRRLVLDLRTVDLQALVEAELAHVRARWMESRMSHFVIDNEVPAGLLVRADPGRLEQILGNLLDNAVKYSAESGRVTVSAHPEGSQVFVGVSDSGPGVSPEDVETLFQRFVRVGDSPGITGTGLGLWIVRSLVELHGGKIEVSSSPGRGTTFRFNLPAAPPSPGSL